MIRIAALFAYKLYSGYLLHMQKGRNLEIANMSEIEILKNVSSPDSRDRGGGASLMIQNIPW